MKGLVLYRVNISVISNQGVTKKMQGQVYGLVQNGWQVDSMYLNEEGVCLNEHVIKKISSGSVQEVLLKYKGFYRFAAKRVEKENYDFVLIRFTTLIPSFIRLLETIKSNGKTKIVIDMPTFPYEQEWKGVKGRVALTIDAALRSKLKENVDYFIHYGLEPTIFGVPCINISNGILPRPFKEADGSELLSLVAVGKWMYWHGLERVLKGLGSYHKKGGSREVHLDVVGEGLALKSYEKMVKDLDLEAYVTFHGAKTGDELEEVYQRSSLGIGTLALHRKGVKIDSSLKNRGYCVRGLPFILGSQDLDFPESTGFVKYFPGEEEVSIEELISFYEDVNISAKEIYHYATEQLTWEKKMTEIIGIVL